MKKTIRGFLTASKVLAIVGIVAFALLLIIQPIVISVDFVKAWNGIDPKFIPQEAQNAFVGNLLGAIVRNFILMACCIASLVLGSISKKKFAVATNHEEVVNPGVLAIIAGALVTVFGIPAGIMMLCMKPENFKEE
ncbi:MAG: hypothetical protein MJ227_02925 [Bacilli bacterium]|nr:hypothetical protein [Bacilli bacterium]